MKNLKISMLFICGAGLTACGGGQPVEVNYVNVDSLNLDGTGRVVPNLVERLASPEGIIHVLADVGTAGVGSAAPTSFKVAVYDLSVCEDMEISGTGFTGDTGCQVLFSQEDDQEAYNAGTVPSGVDFLDFMDEDATRATISAYGATVAAGTYRYGKINAYRLMKVTGEVELDGDAGIVYTKSDAEPLDPTDLNSSKNISPTIGTGPAGEASVVWNQNGFFRFQTPWEFDGAEGIQVDMVFNPEDILKGASNMSNGIIQETESGGKGINIPILKLTPVVHKSSETAQRERYVFTGGNLNGDLVVDLYGVKEDAERTIYGADVRIRYNASQTTDALMDPMSAQSVEVEGEVVTLKDWQDETIVSFTRLAESGDGTVDPTLTCSMGVCQDSATGTATGAITYSMTLADL